MENIVNGRRIVTISLSEENYQSAKKCADILGMSLADAAAALIHAKTCRMGSLTCVLLKPPEASHLVAEDTLGESVSPWTLKPAFLVQIP